MGPQYGGRTAGGPVLPLSRAPARADSKAQGRRKGLEGSTATRRNGGRNGEKGGKRSMGNESSLSRARPARIGIPIMVGLGKKHFHGRSRPAFLLAQGIQVRVSNGGRDCVQAEASRLLPRVRRRPVPSHRGGRSRLIVRRDAVIAAGKYHLFVARAAGGAGSFNAPSASGSHP